MRSARKGGSPRGSYGDKRKRPKHKVRGLKAGARKVLNAAMLGNKKAQATWRKLMREDEHLHQKALRKWLVTQIPVLKDVKREMERTGNLAGVEKLYNKLVDAVLEELDNAHHEGYDQAPRGSSSSSSFRTDFDSGIPAGSFIVSPYSGPPAPGPSGLS